MSVMQSKLMVMTQKIMPTVAMMVAGITVLGMMMVLQVAVMLLMMRSLTVRDPFSDML